MKVKVLKNKSPFEKQLSSADYLKANKEEIMRTWERLARSQISAARNANRLNLRDSLPGFLDHLVLALSPTSPVEVASEDSDICREHGFHRARMGNYSISQSLVEYTLLRKVVVDMLKKEGSASTTDIEIIQSSIELAMIQAAEAFNILQLAKEKKKRVEIQRANHALNLFSSVAAHDLKEPVTAISLAAQVLILELPAANENTREQANFLIKSSKRLSSLIDNLLAFSAVGKQKIKKRSIHTEMLISEVIKNLARLSKEKNALIEFKSFPTVSGYESELYQLFQNLISNALKYSDHPKVTIGFTETNHFWKFYVRDNGVGIEPKNHKKIFEAFERVSVSKDGTGLGLAICKKIVDHHEGRIGVESKPGKGAKFWFTLPK